MPQLGQKLRVRQPVAEVDVTGDLGPGRVHHVEVEQQVLSSGFLLLLANLLQSWNHLAQLPAASLRCLLLRPQRLLGSVELLVSEERALGVEGPEKLESVVGSVDGILPPFSLLQLGVEVLLVVVKHVQLDVSFFGPCNLNVGSRALSNNVSTVNDSSLLQRPC